MKKSILEQEITFKDRLNYFLFNFNQETAKILMICGWVIFFLTIILNSFLKFEKYVFYIPISLFIVSHILTKKYFEATISFLLTSTLFFLWFEYGSTASFIGALVSIPILICVYVIRSIIKKKKRKKGV